MSQMNSQNRQMLASHTITNKTKATTFYIKPHTTYFEHNPNYIKPTHITNKLQKAIFHCFMFLVSF